MLDNRCVKYRELLWAGPDVHAAQKDDDDDDAGYRLGEGSQAKYIGLSYGSS